MRLSRLALGLTLACVASTAADAANTTVRFFAPHTIVITSYSTDQRGLVVGPNRVDYQHKFNCASTIGCTVIMSSATTTNTSPTTKTCFLIDSGSAVGVPCAVDNPNSPNIVKRAVVEVLPGQHTIQTVMQLITGTGNGDELTAWETDYTIYALH